MSVDAGTERRVRFTAVRVATVILPAVLALTLAVVRNSQVPFWRDEFATALFASLTPAELFSATSHVDAVLAPYYLLMHQLSPLLGLGPGMRVVSILAFAASAAVVAMIGGRWWGASGGAVAGVAMALNGDALTAAVNARPYALSVFLVAVAVLLADTAMRHGSVAAWVGYGSVAAAAIALQLLAALAVVAIATLLVGRPGSTVRRWLLASIPAAATAVALVLVGLNHRGQLVWLGRPDAREGILTIARASGVTADRAVVFDAAALGLLVIAGVLSVVAVRSRTSDRISDPVRTRAFCISLMLAPPVLLFTMSWLVTPVFTGKYLIWSSLGAALLLGGAVALLQSPRRTPGVIAGVMAVVLLVLAAVTTGMRLMNPPPRGDDFPAAAQTLERSAAVGDTLIIAQPYAFGGVAYGMATAAGDEGHAAEIRERAVEGAQTVLDTRVITEVSPLRTAPDAAPSTTGPSDATWVLTIFPITEAELNTVDDDVAACLRTIDFSSPTERYGALRLFRLECD